MAAGIMESGRRVYQALHVSSLSRVYYRNHTLFSDEIEVRPGNLEQVKAEMEELWINAQRDLEKTKELGSKSDTSDAPKDSVDVQLRPGDYIGLHLGDQLVNTGRLRDIGKMAGGRIIYEVLLVKNIFQRQYPEIHFSDHADGRPTFKLLC